jgi:hypothetical protein
VKYIFEVGSHGMIYIPNVMKICSGIQIMLRLYHNNLSGFNIGITDGRDL